MWAVSLQESGTGADKGPAEVKAVSIGGTNYGYFSYRRSWLYWKSYLP